MSDASPQFVGSLVAGLAALLGLGVAAKKFSGRPEAREISPQPLQVKQAPEYAEKKELEALRVELMARIAEHERRNETDMSLIRSELTILRRGSDNVQRRINNMATMLYSIAGKLGIVPGALVQAEDEG